ncbi:Flp family type IVb pilin [Gilliamella sp. Pas-s27]|uniref:Flp family type IVb pilin n=1 Tax=Gilliamella sp. Pas-s27 TaxID=2687311 RepID=UPI0013662987|nr:Flp family type IVb pilin [Gilliamella sp. Pas-s27]MWP46329.1 Flp family type IVb pilin [Gilliamella sp. Pas-s27]
MMNLSSLCTKTKTFLGKFTKNEQGVTAIEYVIVAGGVAAVVLVIFDGNGGPVHNAIYGVFKRLLLSMTDIIA